MKFSFASLARQTGASGGIGLVLNRLAARQRARPTLALVAMAGLGLALSTLAQARKRKKQRIGKQPLYYFHHQIFCP